MKDWGGEGLLTAGAICSAWNRKPSATFARTNVFLRLVLFLFTLIVVGAAVGLFFVAFLSRPSEQTVGVFLLIFAAALLRGRRICRFPEPAVSLRD